MKEAAILTLFNRPLQKGILDLPNAEGMIFFGRGLLWCGGECSLFSVVGEGWLKSVAVHCSSSTVLRLPQKNWKSKLFLRCPTDLLSALF